MTYDEAVTAMKAGSKISGRFSEGEYIDMDSSGVMTFHAAEGDLSGWSPANSDRISDEWTIFSQ